MTDRIVIIAGGRDLHPKAEDAWWVRAWLLHLRATVVIHGAGPHRCDSMLCKRDSVDSWGGRIAIRLGLAVRTYPAAFREHGPSAGPRRNLQMLDQGPEALLALPGKRGAEHRPGCGTGHIVHHGRARGILTLVRGLDGMPGDR